MLAAAVAGYADYSTTDGRARVRATVHSMLMLVSLRALRRLAGDPGDRPDQPGAADRPVDRRLPDPGRAARTSAATSSTSWATWSTATPGARRARSGSRWRWARSPRERLVKARLGIQDLVLVRTGDTILALHDQCAHAGGPLNEGTLVDGLRRVPLARLALRARHGPPATRPDGLRPADLRGPAGWRPAATRRGGLVQA